MVLLKDILTSMVLLRIGMVNFGFKTAFDGRPGNTPRSLAVLMMNRLQGA